MILLFLWTLAGCRPDLPVTSTIRIDMESITTPVNQGLYGLHLKELERTDGHGLYAELLSNRSFESEKDSVSDWQPLSPYTYIRRSTNRPLSPSSPHALMISSYTSGQTGRGGVTTQGYGGISVRRGEKYHLSFFMRTATSVIPEPVRIALEDSSASQPVSEVYEATPSFEWMRYRHTFTATEDADKAVLSFSTDRTSFFWLDSLSLSPDRTWNSRPDGFRPDIMERIAALHPSFILYRGDTAHNHFRHYVKICEDLNAESVRTVDSSKVTEKYLYGGKEKGTLRAAILEACFLIRAEHTPGAADERLAFAPVTGNRQEDSPYTPLLFVDGHTAIPSPSYYLLQMFSLNRGDVILKTDVDTYSRPPAAGTDSTPSIVAGATWEKDKRQIVLKVANTTLHNEVTDIIIQGASARSRMQITQIKGEPEWENTADNPRQVFPLEQTAALSGKRIRRYVFPPGSVTVIRLDIRP
jgi:hypothetical protein